MIMAFAWRKRSFLWNWGWFGAITKSQPTDCESHKTQFELYFQTLHHRCSLSKARYFDRSRTSRIRQPEQGFLRTGANAIRTAGRMPISKSAATSVAFLLIAPDFSGANIL